MSEREQLSVTELTIVGNGASQNRMFSSSAVPAAGQWVRGDIVLNSAPSAAGFIGWVCTASGSPGTWKTFGAITA